MTHGQKSHCSANLTEWSDLAAKQGLRNAALCNLRLDVTRYLRPARFAWRLADWWSSGDSNCHCFSRLMSGVVFPSVPAQDVASMRLILQSCAALLNSLEFLLIFDKKVGKGERYKKPTQTSGFRGCPTSAASQGAGFGLADHRNLARSAADMDGPGCCAAGALE